MGQQQLLLLVLGIVIVGLAVVVGIQAFSENQKKANVDAMVNDGVRIASDAQAWALKPAQFGGGAGSFASIDLTKLGYSEVTSTNSGEDVYINLNGEYDITPETATAILITGRNFDAADSTVVDNAISIRVCGFEYDDIKTAQGLNGTAIIEAPACTP